MKEINYKQSEFLLPWKRKRKSPLEIFIAQIPYCLYLTVVPSRIVINEVLISGSAGGGMGTGFTWEPFNIDQSEYQQLLSIWRNLTSKEILKLTDLKFENIEFIFDEEISKIETHTEYLSLSSKKYQSYYTKWPNQA